MRLPAGWSRSRTTAVCVTLVLHAVMAWWLLALRFEVPEGFVAELDFVWLPVPTAPARPPPVDALPIGVPPPEVAPITAPPLSMPVPEVTTAAKPDWSGTARDVAK